MTDRVASPGPDGRQWYERKADLDAEAALASKIAKALHVQPQKLEARAYQIDYCLLRRGRVCGWAEIKIRTNDSTTYDTYLMSLHKYMAGVRLAEATGLPFVLVVGFTDGPMAFMCTGRDGRARDRVHVRMGGRTDRGDRQDTEPTVHLPMSQALDLVQLLDAAW